MTSPPYAEAAETELEGELLTFGDRLAVGDDPVQAQLRQDLRSNDVGIRSDAALRLGAGHLRSNARLGEMVLRQAFEGPPLTAARAMLRLAYAKFASGANSEKAAVSELLCSARERTKIIWFRDGVIHAELLRVRIDLASALAIAGQRGEAIDVLLGADRVLRKVLTGSSPHDPTTRELKRLRGLVNLRLGQTQMDTDGDSADAAFRVAAKYGSQSVMATAAWELGQMLERRGGNGPDIEEQYRRAAEAGDMFASPPAMVSLGDLLWRHNRRDLAPEWWARAKEAGNDLIAERVHRRVTGEWQAKQNLTRIGNAQSKAPLSGDIPPTPLGRVASGRTSIEFPTPDGKVKVKTIVVGAGTGGHYLLPGLRHLYETAGFVDDHFEDIQRVGEVPVIGPIDSLRGHLENDPDIRLVIFAIPTANGATRLRAVEATLEAQRQMLTLPSMFELWRGQPLVPQLRPMELHETFGSFPWDVDRAAAAVARGRRVAITGAGTWIGRALARRVVHGQARHLLLIDEAPVQLRRIADELHMIPDAIEFDARVVDSAEKVGVSEVFSQFKPDLVFHCDSLSYLPPQVLPLAHAARANVQSAAIVAQLAREHGAEDFVLASADRAGHRSSEFDMTKALAEHAVLKHAAEPHAPVSSLAELRFHEKPGLRVSVLRLPNVWAKDGPIVGRLTDQLSRGGPLQVDRRASRRFIPTWEAAQALLRVVDADHIGGIFAYTGGETVTIRDIADRLIWMNGLKVGLQVGIVDDPNMETKLSLDTVGPNERRGSRCAPHTISVEQPEGVAEALSERAERLLAVLRKKGAPVGEPLDPATLQESSMGLRLQAVR